MCPYGSYTPPQGQTYRQTTHIYPCLLKRKCIMATQMHRRRRARVEIDREPPPLPLTPTRRVPDGASRVVQSMPARSVKTQRVPSRHCRDAPVNYGLTMTAMHDNEYYHPQSPSTLRENAIRTPSPACAGCCCRQYK